MPDRFDKLRTGMVGIAHPTDEFTWKAPLVLDLRLTQIFMHLYSMNVSPNWCIFLTKLFIV